MQRLEVSGAIRSIYGSLGVKGLKFFWCAGLHVTVISLVFVPCTAFNLLTPNDQYMDRIAPLTSKRWILYIYSTNIGTEYLKHALYSPFFLFEMQFVS